MPDPVTPIQAYSADGTPLGDHEFSDAVAKGQAYFKRTDQIPMLDESGQAMLVPGDQVYHAIGQGWQFESPDHQELRQYQKNASFGEAAKTVAEHAADVATFGISSQILSLPEVGGEDYVKRERLREQAFPGASAGGEALGLLAQLGAEGLAAHGAGAVGKAAEAATILPRGVSSLARGAGSLAERGATALVGEGTGLISRGLRAGVRLGTEGAVEGAAFGAGREISESALGDHDLTAERLLSGAYHGALLGGITGGGLGLGGAAIARGAESISSVLRPLAKKFGEELGGSVEGFARNKALQAFGAQGSDLARIERLAGGGERGAARLERLGNTALEQLKVPEAGALENLASRAERIRNVVKQAGEDLGDTLKQIDEKGILPDPQPIRQKLDDYVGQLRSGATGDDIRAAKRVEKFFEPTLAKLEPSADGALPSLTFEDLHSIRRDIDKRIFAAGRSVQKDLSQARGIFEGAIQDQIATIDPQLAEQYAAQKAAFQDATTLSQIAGKRTQSLAGNRTISLTDTLGAIGGSIALGPKGLLGAGVNKLIRSTASDALAARIADKLGGLGKVKDLADAQALKLAAATRKALGRSESAAVSAPAKGYLLYEQHAAHVRDYQANPEKAVEQMSARLAPLRQVAPNVADSAMRIQAGDQQYLAQHLPRVGSSGGLLPTRVRAPSMGEQRSFMQRVDTLKDPSSVLESVHRGNLTREQVETLKERRPKLYEQMQQEAIDQLADMSARGKQPNFQTRLAMAKLFGIITEPTEEPQAIKAIQAIHAARHGASAGGQAIPTPKLSQAGGKASKLAGRRKTGLEELESS